MVKGPKAWEGPKDLQGVFYVSIPQEADSELEFSISKMYYRVIEINPYGGARKVGLGKGGCWAIVQSLKRS